MKRKGAGAGANGFSQVYYKYIPCVNTEFNETIHWFGRICDNWEVKVDENCTRVVCGTCVAHITSPGDPALKKLERENYPKGWALLKVFVNEKGVVFFKGKEQPDLKGTLPPTVIEENEIKESKEPKERKQRVKKDNTLKDTNNIQISKLKKLLKITASPKEQQKIVKEIKQLEKEIIRDK